MVNINLTVSGSKECIGCSVGAGAGTSSSAVALTRNVLGLQPASSVYPPSNLPKRDPTDNRPIPFGPPGNLSCNGGCYYTPPYSSNGRDGGKVPPTKLSATADPPTLLSNMAEGWQNAGVFYYFQYLVQKNAEAATRAKIDAAASSTLSAPIWMPSDPGSVAKNEKNYGALTKLFLKPTLPFTMSMSSPAANATIDLMSVYQPFPLRVNGEQCDACFQIGEFKMPDTMGVGTDIVVLIPLKVSPNTSKGGAFINAFANAIPDVLAGTPDKINGYPDGQVTGLSDWKISDILQSDRPFYTWTNKDGTRVVVMAEPIGISDANMTNIKRLPLTQPGDVMKEISGTIYYKSAPPLKVDQTPSMFRISQPSIKLPDNTAQKEMIGKVLANVGFFLLTVFAIWLALWLAINKGATAMTWISNKLGDGISSVAETTKTGIAQ